MQLMKSTRRGRGGNEYLGKWNVVCPINQGERARCEGNVFVLLILFLSLILLVFPSYYTVRIPFGCSSTSYLFIDRVVVHYRHLLFHPIDQTGGWHPVDDTPSSCVLLKEGVRGSVERGCWEGVCERERWEGVLRKGGWEGVCERED